MSLNLPEEKQIPDIQVYFESQHPQTLDYYENILHENYYEPSVYDTLRYCLQSWILEKGLEGTGFGLYQSGLYEQAIDSYNQALIHKPDNHHILNNLGVAFNFMDRHQEAISSYDRVISLKPNDNQAWNNRGNALHMLGQHQGAITCYDKALKIKSNSHAAWNNRGNVLFKLGQYEKAIASYDKACKFEPDYNESYFKQSKGNLKQKKTFKVSESFYIVWHQRGNALCCLNRYKEAIESYSEALRFVPTEYETYYNRGNAMSKLGYHKEALENYNSCLRFNKKCFQALVNKGNALYSLSNYNEAVKSYEESLQLKPKDYRVLYNKGNALFKLGRYREAINSYREALKINNNYYPALNNMGNVLFRLDIYSEAIVCYESALTTENDYFIALYNMGNTFSKSELDLPRADKCYEEALSIKPEDYAALNNRANTLGHLHDYAKAVQTYKKALEYKSNNHALVWSNISKLHFNFGDFEKALEAYKKALKLNPEDHSLWYNMGTILYKLSRYPEALEHYKQALKINSNNHIIWCDKGNILFKLGHLEEALESYKEALKINPDYITALCNLCLVQSKLSLYSQAFITYNKIERIQTNYFDDWRDFFDALSNLARSSKQSSINSIENFFNRGVWLYKVGIYHEAIDYFDRALKSKKNFYQAWLWRGKALHDMGEYQKAIDSFKQSLKYKSDLPEAWYNMGKALYKIGHYHNAVDSFRRALEFQSDYYEVLYYIGIVFYKLNRYHEAIDSYGKALKLKPDDLYSLYNRGLSQSNLARLDLSSNESKTWLKGAIIDLERVLTINKQTWQAWQEIGWALFYHLGYEQALEKWQEGIKVIRSAKPVNLEGCGVLYYACGCANYEYSKKLSHTKERLNFWQEARTNYQKALIFFSAKDMRERYLEVLEELIKVCHNLGETAQVRALGKDGTAILQLLLQETTSEKNKIKLKRKFSGLAGLRIDNLVKSFRRSHHVKALEESEQHKNDCLSWFQDNHSNDVNCNPKYSEIQKLLNSHTAMIYWYISPVAVTTFILKYQRPLLVWHYQQSPNIFIRNCQRFLAFLSNVFRKERLLKQNSLSTEQLQKFETWLANWKQNGKKYLKGQEGDVNSTLAELANILDIKEISRYLSEIDNLILIPHRDLHLLPLEVLFSNQFITSRLPSAQIGLAKVIHNSKLNAENTFSSFSTQLEKNISLLSVENPRDDLLFASVESSAICQFYSPFKHLRGQDAIKDNVTAALQTYIPHGAFHFTGHAFHNIDEPLESALCLANEEYLTLRDIFHLNLSCYQLACLSACETGMTGKRDLIDEFVGLPSGFLNAGVTYIVSSLWRVNDLSTAFLMIKFYENLQFSASVPKALNEAQTWLRDRTQADLLAWSGNLSLEQEFKDKIKRKLDSYKSDKKPYALPYYWAAFFTIG
ncbi:TPR repeat-containing protein (plasmid) [Calothrix sp. PCC 7716]|nr:TPR repeat-containing protein [Calothrix sp. PCC 7716]